MRVIWTQRLRGSSVSTASTCVAIALTIARDCRKVVRLGNERGPGSPGAPSSSTGRSAGYLVRSCAASRTLSAAWRALPLASSSTPSRFLALSPVRSPCACFAAALGLVELALGLLFDAHLSNLLECGSRVRTVRRPKPSSGDGAPRSRLVAAGRRLSIEEWSVPHPHARSRRSVSLGLARRGCHASRQCSPRDDPLNLTQIPRSSLTVSRSRRPARAASRARAAAGARRASARSRCARRSGSASGPPRSAGR